MIDNRTKSIPTSSSEVGIYYVYISQGNKDNGVYIVSDFSLPITVTKIAELYIGDSTKANLNGGNTFTGNQIINGDIIIQDITANNFIGNSSTATKLKTFVNINGVAFDGSSNITIYDSTKEDTISVGTVSQYFRGDKTWQTLNKIVVGLSNVDNTADANKNVFSATKLTIPRTINNVSFDGSENIVINAVDITPRIPVSYMGIANGVATLDNTGIIPITQLPSYVDDVIEVANYESLPTIGERGKIYVTTNNNKTYRWSGSVYIYITSGAVDSVNGYTGVVVLTKSDFILGNVDNTSDANKPVSIATQSALDLKQNLLTLGNFTSTTPGITISNGTGAVIGSGITFNITTAGTNTGGLITSGHWNSFNNKWDSSNHPITTLGYGLPDYPTTLPASDVYSWAKQSTKPTYSYSEITSKPTNLSQFTNNLGNYGGWITGITNSMITTALGYTPWYSGNHPTTISGYGITDIPIYSGINFIQNQNSSAQSANMWISGNGYFQGNLLANTFGGYSGEDVIITTNTSGATNLIFKTSQTEALRIAGGGGAATFASTVKATGFLLNGNNLTSSLSADYLPKWNGSSFVNSLISNIAGSITVNLDAVDGRGLYVYSAGVNNDPYIKMGRAGGLTDVFNIGLRGGTGNTAMLSLFGQSGSSTGLHLMGNGDVKILTATQSTSPTTGALVVNGGVGVGGVANLGGSRVSGNVILSNGEGLESYYNPADKTIYIQNYHRGIDNLYHPIYMAGSYFGISQGNFGIGYATDQGYKLAVNGAGYFNGNVTASNFILSSDRTLKTNIQPIIKDYSKLDLVSFNFKDNLDELRFGTIAQDLLSGGFNEFVTGDKEGEYKVKYIDLIIAKLASAELRIKQLEDKYCSR